MPVRASTLAVTIAALALGCAGPAAAFDGDRRGFLLGASGGLHTSDGDESGDGFADFDSSTSGLALRLMIGGGISDRLTVYGTRDFNLDSDDVVFGLTGIGSRFYLRGNGPSAYLHAALGVGDVTFDVDDRRNDDRYYDDYDSAYGVGAALGAGYAFTQGFHVDGSLMVVDVTDDDNFARDVDYTYVSLRAMAGYTWY